nr:hypothetical protein CFP56_69693 [Quercus suber]
MSTSYLAKFNVLRYRERKKKLRLQNHENPLPSSSEHSTHPEGAESDPAPLDPEEPHSYVRLDDPEDSGEAEYSEQAEDSEGPSNLKQPSRDGDAEDTVPLIPHVRFSIPPPRKSSNPLVSWLDSEGQGIDPAKLVGKCLCLWPPVKPGLDRYVIEHNKYPSFYREHRQEPDPDNRGHREVGVAKAGLKWLVFQVFDPDEHAETLVHLLPKHAVESRAGRTTERPQEFVHYLCETALGKLLVTEPRGGAGNSEEGGEEKRMLRILDARFGVLIGADIADTRVIGLQLEGMPSIGYITCGSEERPFDLLLTGTAPGPLPRSFE